MFIWTRILNLPAVTRLTTHLHEPLYRNGYALVFSSAASSGLGMIYWIVAARSYTTEVVGLNSAMIAAMIFLANVSQFNLTNALNRFLPNMSRDSARRMVAYTHLISQVMAILSSLIFIFSISVWEPELSFLGSSPTFVFWFTGATMIWCIFVLQDSALTGLRQSVWVAGKNLLFALAKIGLLVIMVAISPLYGVFASWTIAVVITILPTNLLLFGRLIPQHVVATGDRVESIKLSQIVKYVAGDYLGSLVSMAATSLLPIIIVAKISATANAYFSLSWTIAYALYLISRNMGMSFIAEVAADQSNLNVISYRLFINTARLMVPLVFVIVIGAHYILHLFGANYAAEGTPVLRLLCLSALPNMITSLYTSIVRVQRRIVALFIVLTVPYILVLVFSYLFMETYGVIGVGIAWLASQSLAAGVLLATELRVMWMTGNSEKENIKL